MQPTLVDLELTALLGRGTRFEGKLTFDGTVRIDGSFVGEVRSPGVLVIGEGAHVQADIFVGALIVKGGKLRGNVQARDSVDLLVPAQVNGNLRAPEISIERGVQFAGECIIEPRGADADEPAA